MSRHGAISFSPLLKLLLPSSPSLRSPSPPPPPPLSTSTDDPQLNTEATTVFSEKSLVFYFQSACSKLGRPNLTRVSGDLPPENWSFLCILVNLWSKLVAEMQSHQPRVQLQVTQPIRASHGSCGFLTTCRLLRKHFSINSVQFKKLSHLI